MLLLLPCLPPHELSLEVLLYSVDIVPPFFLSSRCPTNPTLCCSFLQILTLLRTEAALLDLLFCDLLFRLLEFEITLLLPDESALHHVALEIVVDVVVLDLRFEGALGDLLLQFLFQVPRYLALVGHFSLAFEFMESLPPLLPRSSRFVMLVQLDRDRVESRFEEEL